MPKAPPELGVKSIDHVAQLLARVVDAGSSPDQAGELIDEVSELLWAITDLGPDREQLLRQSGCAADIVSKPSDLYASQITRPRPARVIAS